MPTLAKRVDAMRRMSVEQGKTMPTVGVIPPTSIEATREKALSCVNIPGLLAWANRSKWSVKPASGAFETTDDLEGQLIAGNPDDAVRECEKFARNGVDHLVFDLRFKFEKWFDQIQLLGNEVLPQLR